MRIETAKYHLSTKKNVTQFNICLLSDIHFRKGYSLEKIKLIIEKIKNCNPNYICIAGDLVHDAKNIGDLELLKEFLQYLSAIAPTVMSLGNHDMLTYDNGWKHYFNDRYFQVFEEVQNFNLLDNQTICLGNVQFTGITMPYQYYETENESCNYLMQMCSSLPIELLEKKDELLYQIMLFHSPISLLEVAKKENLKCLNDTDLVLSGHMHGGLTPSILEPILGNHGLIGPTTLKERAFFPKNVRGCIDMERFNVIISTGVSKLNIPGIDVVFPANINSITVSNQKILKK